MFFFLDHGDFFSLTYSFHQTVLPRVQYSSQTEVFPPRITCQRAVNSIIFLSMWPSTFLSSGRHPFCICDIAAWTEIRAFHIEQSLLQGFVVRCITGGDTQQHVIRVQSPARSLSAATHRARSIDCHTSLPLHPKSTNQFILPSFLSVKVDIQGVCMT